MPSDIAGKLQQGLFLSELQNEDLFDLIQKRLRVVSEQLAVTKCFAVFNNLAAVQWSNYSRSYYVYTNVMN